MQNEKPRLVIFDNKKAGQQVIKKDGQAAMYNDRPITEPHFRGIINLPHDLQEGDYEVSIYKNKSKNGNYYYSGNIKPKYQNPENDIQKKSPEKKIEITQSIHDEVPFHDDVPF